MQETATSPPAFPKTRILFLAAGFYNFGLAAFFLLEQPFGADFSLVHFAAALLVVFGVMFCNIAKHPVRYKLLIPYAVLRNAAYCALAGWYFYKGRLPLSLMFPGVADAVLGVCFLVLWGRLFWEDED